MYNIWAGGRLVFIHGKHGEEREGGRGCVAFHGAG